MNQPLRAPRALALAALAAFAFPALAEDPAPFPPADPVLAQLIDEALTVRPEVAQAEALAKADRARVPQAGAFPDPVLSFGIQNDGFNGIQIGTMETSFWSAIVSQTFPWPGKRHLRAEAARLGADATEASVARARLGVEADVRRGYVDLVIARDRLVLLARLEALWKRSEELARTRYEAGEGAQSDLLRAQLERGRLRQRRLGLESSERTAVQALNRLRRQPLETPIATTVTARDLPLPAPLGVDASLADATGRSPELASARLDAKRAQEEAALARRERFPDVTINAGIMPRGRLEPMWTASVSFPIPIFAGSKQNRAVDEREARAAAGERSAEAVQDLVRIRAAERRVALAALLDQIRLYRDGILVQSQATVDSTLAQYRVGRVTFASVLEALAGLVSDEEAFLGDVADAQRLAIARGEVSLSPAALAGAASVSAAMPGAGAVGGAAAPGGGAAGAGAAGTEAASTGGGMPSGM